jgi:UDP-GlcNAc3NAcA epimerase
LHVEAGLRSFRSDMPEERNRIATDRIADVMFAPTVGAVRNLAELDVAGTVHLTGDVLCDVLRATRDKLPPGEARGEYLLATVHRNYNTDDPERLKAVLSCLECAPCPVVLPLHPRTRLRIEEAGLRMPANVELCGPVTYSQMLVLERDAAAIATDSGGVQREAYLWGVPCLTLREETEWVETVQTGWNTIVGADPAAFRAALGRPRPTERPPVFGDGHAAERIAALVSEHIADRHIIEEANVA